MNMSRDAPVEVSAEEYQRQCDERLRESFTKILVERDAERGEFNVNWRCWDVFRTIRPSHHFPIYEFQAVAQQCANQGYRLIEKLPASKQQKAYKKLQGLCQHTQSALWSGRITSLELAVGNELLHITELYAWDHQTILVKAPQGEATLVRYFFVPAGSTALRIRKAQPEPFMLRVLADPRMATVLL